MKKIVSLLLCITLLISLSAGMRFSAYADEKEIIGFEYCVGTPALIYYEGYDGVTRTDSDGDTYYYYDEHLYARNGQDAATGSRHDGQSDCTKAGAESSESDKDSMSSTFTLNEFFLKFK